MNHNVQKKIGIIGKNQITGEECVFGDNAIHTYSAMVLTQPTTVYFIEKQKFMNSSGNLGKVFESIIKLSMEKLSYREQKIVNNKICFDLKSIKPRKGVNGNTALTK